MLEKCFGEKDEVVLMELGEVAINEQVSI